MLQKTQVDGFHTFSCLGLYESQKLTHAVHLLLTSVLDESRARA